MSIDPRAQDAVRWSKYLRARRSLRKSEEVMQQDRYKFEVAFSEIRGGVHFKHISNKI